MPRQAKPITGAAAAARPRSRSAAARTRAAASRRWRTSPSAPAASISAPASTPPRRRCATARIRPWPESTQRRMYLTARRDAQQLNLELSGEWRALRFADIEAELEAVDFSDVSRVEIGAWQVRDFIDRVRAAGATIHFREAEPATLGLVERCRTGEISVHTHGIEWLDPAHAVEGIGRRAVRGLQRTADGLSFLGRISLALLRALPRL